MTSDSEAQDEVFLQSKKGIAVMKKFVFAAIAAVVVAASFSGAAEAHRRHFEGDWRWGGPHHRPHWDVVVFRPHCHTTKIIKKTDWGTKVVVFNSCR